MAKHPSTWPTFAAHSLQSHLGGVSDPPADNFSTYRARYRLSSFARRAFSVAGRSAWNSLPEYLRDPAFGRNSFRKQLRPRDTGDIYSSTSIRQQ